MLAPLPMVDMHMRRAAVAKARLVAHDLAQIKVSLRISVCVRRVFLVPRIRIRICVSIRIAVIRGGWKG